MFNSKFVVRAGWGMYYDRGELFSYLSPGVSQNITNGGPFGINQQQPFVGTQSCGSDGQLRSDLAKTHSARLLRSYNLLGTPVGSVLPNALHLSANFDSTRFPTASLQVYANTTYIRHHFTWAPTQRNNKLPYTMNSTLDIQWQPRNDLAIDIGYVNALGRHEIIPIRSIRQDCVPNESAVRASCRLR